MPLGELLEYQGNAALAGGSGTGQNLGVVSLNRTFDAVDRFTAYTMQVNRDMWVQANLEMQKTANEAAKNLSVTYGDLIPEDREKVDEAVKDLYDYYSKNPNAVRYIIDPVSGENNKDAYNEFLQKRATLDHLVVRGNIRANQLGEIDKQRSQIADPQKLKQFDSIVLSERKKPIGENLLIPPDIAPFNWGAYIEDRSKEGARSFEFIQRFSEDNLTVTKDLFDPIAASARVATDLNSDTPLSEEIKKNLALQLIAIKGVIGKHTVTDANGNSTLDRKGLEADNDARPFMEQVKTYNQHIHAMNNTEAVENGRKTGKRIREFLGYSQDLPEIDVNNISDMDLVRAAMTYKLGIKTGTKIAQTDNALQRRGQDLAYLASQNRLQWDKDSFWVNFNTGKKAQEGIADEKILSYYNLMNTPQVSDPRMEVIDTQYNKDKSVKSKSAIGFEIGVTPQLAQIFAIPKNTTKTTTKDVSGAGAYTNQGFTSTVEESKSKIPYRIFVSKDPSGDPNKNTVKVRYDDSSVQTFSAGQVFTAFNKLFGDDEKVQSSVSQVSIKRLADWGLTQPDIKAIGKQLGNLTERPPLTDITKPPNEQPQPKKKKSYADLFK